MGIEPTSIGRWEGCRFVSLPLVSLGWVSLLNPTYKISLIFNYLMRFVWGIIL